MSLSSSAEDFLESVCSQLADGGIEESAIEGRMIVEEILGIDYSRIRSGLASPPTPDDIDEAHVLISQRLTGQPIAHVLGYAYFYGNRFNVTSGVMVPRPETETLVDLAVRMIDSISDHPPRVLDLYTGCGNVLISILKARPNAAGIGYDIDPVSIMCASRNRRALGSHNAEFRLENVSRVLKQNGHQFDLVTANPPYIESGSVSTLQVEVSRHENKKALDGGPDGLDQYRMLAKLANNVIIPGGALLAEIGINQDIPVQDIFTGWDKLEFRNDLNGIPRVLIAHP